MPMRLLERYAHRATRLPRMAKTWIAVTADAVAIPLALLFALTLKRGSFAGAAEASIWLYAAAAPISIGVLAPLGAYRAVFRYISPGVLFRSALGVICSSVLFGLLNSTLLQSAVPGESIVIFTAIALLYIIGSRALVREWLYLRRGQKQK